MEPPRRPHPTGVPAMSDEQESVMDDEAIERAAQSLHANRCRRNGIHDPQSIALYWTSCNQEMYRKHARIKSSPPSA